MGGLIVAPVCFNARPRRLKLRATAGRKSTIVKRNVRGFQGRQRGPERETGKKECIGIEGYIKMDRHGRGGMGTGAVAD